MKWKSCLLIGIAGSLLVVLSCGIASNGKDRHAGLEFQSNNPDEYGYLLYVPDDESPSRPLLVFLHGSGETGKGADRLRKCNPFHYFMKTKPTRKFPFVVACPLAGHDGWNADRIASTIRRIIGESRWRTDPERLYLTGFSMGGGATFRITSEYPDLFAAIVPVAGMADPERAESLRNIPTWAFHGEEDMTIPPERDAEMIDAMQEAGNKEAWLTILPEVGHGIAAAVYSRPEIYEWLLKQRRKPE